MQDTSGVQFGPFRLKGPHGPLMRGTEAIKLTPKATALLWELVRHAGQVMPRSVLFDTVWPRLIVSEDALDYQIRALRRALGDSVRAPEYIATIHGVGFRFIADVQALDNNPPASRAAPDTSSTTSWLTGRTAELQQLDTCFGHACDGTRQTVFVTGEGGIGKTALAQAFIRSIAQWAPRATPVHIAAGQCLYQTGAAEPFLPILQALEHLCRATGGNDIITLLRRWAPTVLVRLRPLIDDREYDALRETTAGARHTRVRREIVECLEVLAEQQPLVLWLEDLQWSDNATIEVISMLAQRRYPTRLLLLSSYRPTETAGATHRVLHMKRELVGRQQAREIPLSNLDVDAVQYYLEQRWDHCPDSTTDFAGLAAAIHERSDGHALFMVHLADHLAEKQTHDTSVTLPSDIPAALQDLIEQQLMQLSEADQAVIGAGAAVGAEFTAADVAAALSAGLQAISDQCERLARQGQFITSHGLTIWPDGTRTPRYRFQHTLAMEVINQLDTGSDRVRQYALIAERRERAWGEAAQDIAAQLADLYERAAWAEKELRYRIDAGRKALQRGNGHAARHQSESGLSRVDRVFEREDRDRVEMMLQITRVAALALAEGFADPRVQQGLQRIGLLSATVTDTATLAYGLCYQWAFQQFRNRLSDATRVAERLTRLGEHSDDARIQCLGLSREGISVFMLAHHDNAQAATRNALNLAATRDTHAWSDDGRPGPELIAQCTLSHIRWITGYPDHSLQLANDILQRAEALDSPLTVCAAVSQGMTITQLFRRDARALLDTCERATALCERYGYTEGLDRSRKYRAVAQCLLGNRVEGLAELRTCMTTNEPLSPVRMLTVDWCHLAEFSIQAGDLDTARDALDKAITRIEHNDSHFWEPELWRIEAQWHLAHDTDQRGAELAEKRLQQALDIARTQKARALELRAAMELAGLWYQQGYAGGRDLLQSVYDTFTEGWHTHDLQQARALLDILATPNRANAGSSQAHPDMLRRH